MPILQIHPSAEGIWPDLQPLALEGQLLQAMGPDAPAIEVALLRGGMVSGAPSVTIRINLPDGRVVLTETSLQLFLAAADALRAAAQG
jgi:hypothetical protein